MVKTLVFDTIMRRFESFYSKFNICNCFKYSIVRIIKLLFKICCQNKMYFDKVHSAFILNIYIQQNGLERFYEVWFRHYLK